MRVDLDINENLKLKQIGLRCIWKMRTCVQSKYILYVQPTAPFMVRPRSAPGTPAARAARLAEDVSFQLTGVPELRARVRVFSRVRVSVCARVCVCVCVRMMHARAPTLCGYKIVSLF